MLTFTGREPHPAIPLMEAEVRKYLAAGQTEIVERFYAARAKALYLSSYDPLRHGMELDVWKKADDQVAELKKLFPSGVTHLVNLGGNRSSKTTRAAKRVMQLAIDKPGARIWCLQSTEAASRADQQGLIFNFLPPEWRPDSGRLKQGRTTKIVYSESSGFTNNHLVLPNGSQIWFKFYGANVKTLEGAEIDFAWCFVSGTQISVSLGSQNIEDIIEGQDVLTSAGPRRVTSTGSHLARVGTVRFSDGRELTGTADHPVLTTSHGWTKLSELKLGDQVCAINVSSGVGKRGIPIPANITLGKPRETEAFDSSSIEKFTVTASAQSLQDITSTTGTGTPSTTRLRTSSAYRHPIMPDFILDCEGIQCEKLGAQQQRGRCNAPIVVSMSSVRPPSEESCAFAASEIKLNPNEKFSASVAYVGNNLLRAEEIFAVNVVSIWEDAGEATVYNLKVWDRPEFFANGILCHNCDELIEPDWIEALRFRLLNRNGHILLTFTPVEGYSSTVRMYLENAVTLEEKEAELLPNFDNDGNIVSHDTVPVVQQSGIPQARIIYFHGEDNPFGNYEGMKVEVRGSSAERIKMRAYGVPTKSASSQFSFNSAVHVITPAEFQDWLKKYPGGTRYHMVDPCSGRNWFMGWAFCPHPDMVIWYREWPSFGHPAAYIEGIGDPGPWATLVTTKARREGTKPPEDGEKGPAQEPFKFSLRRYQEEIIKVEKGEVVFERWMDARFGNSPKEEESGVTNLIQQMDKLGMQFCPMVSENKILGVNDGSIDLINSALYYDKTKKLGEYSDELARANSPQLLVVNTCPNIIFALETWTGKDGGSGACKDAIDVIRGFYLSQLGYVGADSMRIRGGSQGY